MSLWEDKISPWVLASTADGAQSDFLVVLNAQADLSAAYSLPTKQARGRFVYATLWKTAQREQAPLRAWLDAQGVPYRSFYIVNLIHVRAGDRALVEALAAHPDVARIEANPRIHNARPRPQTYVTPSALHTIQSNIQQVNADDVWGLGYTGQDIVIGGQDTGYAWNHPALVNQYRGWDGSSVNHDYNWHDAVHSGGGSCGADSPQPCDDHGHGTHTMGIALGSDDSAHPLTATNAIGVAPDARWIGCRNMDVGDGTPATYLECFEFFLAPYPVNGTALLGNPDLAPDVTNNSWGCPPSEGCSWDTLQAAAEAHRAAGILTVSSAGNDGPSCSSVREPVALYDATYTVGSVNGSDNIVSSSSRGPVTIDGSQRLKPNISAPGLSIRSSTRDGSYGFMSGTSMASPHVAGAVALLWSAQPALRGQLDQTQDILNTAALPRYSTQCGDPAG
ncbi:MAG: S8 family serine peptidase, partial [Anaerolineae bacterium]